MNDILFRVQHYMEKANLGETTMSPELVEKFGDMCKAAIARQFNKEPRGATIRMSGVGHPLCQQQLSYMGVVEEMEHNATSKFLYGDAVEAMAMCIMEAAGVNIEQEQTVCELEIGGITLRGTLDCVIDGKVWDVKSASPYSFDTKFITYGGFHKILDDDAFGYIPQGYAYSEAVGLPFGGWIVVNKVNGLWGVCETPLQDGEYRNAALAKIEENIEKLVSKAPFERSFDDEPEMFKNKDKLSVRTGNRVLGTNCGFCGYKAHCWPDAEMHPKVTSKAKTRPMTWYSKYVKTDTEGL